MGWINDIKDRIKGMFNRNKRLPESQDSIMAYSDGYSNIFSNETMYNLTRNDGSILQIAPKLDKVGNQTYEQVYNSRTGEFQAIPKFIIMSDELKQIIDSKLLQHTVLIDINPNLLKNSYYSNFIANQMLNANRMQKIVHEYGNYVGTIRLDENRMPIMMKDEGIIETLNNKKEINARRVEEDRARREAEEIDKIMRNAQQIQPHIKSDHAEDLSKY